MSIPDCTLTTCCFDLTKYHKSSRSLNDCINNMKSLLEIPCYLVIYADNNCIEKVQNIRNSFGLDNLTKYILIEIKDLPKYKYLEKIYKNREIYHPTKDERTCPENHILQLSKTDLVLKTMDDNPFHTSKFGWIDSNLGSSNCNKISENYQNNMLLYILKNSNPDKFHIQILNVCDKKYKEFNLKKEYYNQYRWVVCGSFYLTGYEIGKKILNRFNEIANNITEQGYGHGDEMCYLEILDEYYDDIERSYGDYYHILNNFIEPTKGYNYILNFIIIKYINFRYHKEGYDCCKKLLDQIENYKVNIDYEIYFLILFYYYISCYYYKNEEAKIIALKIKKLISENKYLENEYNKNKVFYDNQLNYSL